MYHALKVDFYLLKYSFVHTYFAVIMLATVPMIYVCPGALSVPLNTNIIVLSFLQPYRPRVSDAPKALPCTG